MVFQIYDKDFNGGITKEEFVEEYNKGNVLPDFGTGPGHHGDDEYEYEYVVHILEIVAPENGRHC